MKVDSINLYNTYKSPSFEGNPLTLDKVINKRGYLLPTRVLESAKEAVKAKQLPTLKELHEKAYAPLMDCKTLEEAKELFPEFRGIKEAKGSFERLSGNIKKLKDNGYLEEGLSLKLLQDFWVKLKSQDEVAQDLGLKNRSAIGWVLQKIGFVNMSSNYRTLMLSTDPEINKTIASKTTAWNAAHPDLMRAHNKKAAQYMKKSENREAHSLRMKKYFAENPQRRDQISKTSTKYWSDDKHRLEQSLRGREYAIAHPEKAEKSRIRSKAAWNTIPEAKLLMSKFFKDYVAEDKILSARLRNVFSKRAKGQILTDYDQMILGQFNKAFFDAHPEVKNMLSGAYKSIKLDI